MDILNILIYGSDLADFWQWSVIKLNNNGKEFKYITSEINCVYCKMLGKQCVYVVEIVVIIIIIFLQSK